MYEHGNGIAKDIVEAFSWYQRAAIQGNACAQYHLGACYELGKGVAPDDGEAIKWYRKASAQGNKSAQEALSKKGLCW